MKEGRKEGRKDRLKDRLKEGRKEGRISEEDKTDHKLKKWKEIKQTWKMGFRKEEK